MQKQIPIIFSTPMVAAVLNKTKDITRRKNGLEKINELIDLEIPVEFLRMQRYDDGSYRAIFDIDDEPGSIKCPYGGPGDLLWVRETFMKLPREGFYHYKTGKPGVQGFDIRTKIFEEEGLKWKPSIHMPKAAARIWLEVVSVRVERLKDITEEDARREGILHENNLVHGPRYYHYGLKAFGMDLPIYSFKTLWNSINGEDAWEQNPWVWVIEFKKVNR